MKKINRLIPINKYNRPNRPSSCDEIAIHYTGDPGATAEQLATYYLNVARGRFPNQPAAWTSANYIVGIDGTIITCIRAGEMSYAVSGCNHRLINIEICHADKYGKFSAAAVASLSELVQRLMRAYNIPPERVKRHYDYTGKKCPLFYVEHENEWKSLHAQITGQPTNTITLTNLTPEQRQTVLDFLQKTHIPFNFTIT